MSDPPDRQKKNPFVTLEMCELKHAQVMIKFEELKTDIDAVKKALVGEDMQGGLVKAVADLKSSIQMGSELKNWLKPIIVAIVVAGVTYFVCEGLPS